MVVDPDTLARLSGYRRPADIERWCTTHRVPYFRGRGGRPCTTLDALNTALGIGPSAATDQPIQPQRIEF